MKEQIVTAVKKTALYKLLKTSEAVVVIAGLILGVIFGWFQLVPALVILGAYTVLNLTGLANEPLWVVRDRVEDEIDERRDNI